MRPWRIGLALYAVGLAVFAWIRIPAVVVAIAAFGLPLLLLSYLLASRAVPRGAASVAVTAGAVLGWLWALAAGRLIPVEFRGVIEVPGAGRGVLIATVAAAIGAAVLMAVPAALVRLLRPRAVTARGGLVIGVLGALAFSAAATVTRLAPQFATGLIPHSRPRSNVVLEAALCGVVIPLMAAATGAVIGLALWIRPRRAALWLLGAAVVGLHGAAGLVDAAVLPAMVMLALHLLLTVTALLLMRIAMRTAQLPPPAPAERRPSALRALGGWLAAVGAAAAVLLAITLSVSKPGALYLCPPQCGRPPSGPPVADLPRFTAPDGAFSMSYPAPDAAYEITHEPRGVAARFTAGDGGLMQLFGEAAGGREAKQVVWAAIRRAYPAAVTGYEIPNATLGYQPGYGVVADVWPQSTTAGYTRIRIVAMAAVKNDTALVAVATGPWRRFRPGFGPGTPSGANLDLAQDMGKYVNGFQWRGDPPR